MKKILLAAASACLMAAPISTAIAQDGRGHERSERHDRGGDRHDRGDRGGRGGGWDRDGRGGWDRGDNRRGGHRGHRDGDIVGGVIGGLLGGFLLGESQSYRYRYNDHDGYYSRRGYDRGYYDNWTRRDRGSGCSIVGYGRGCRTIHYSSNFMILNLGGEVYCYRRAHRGWTPSYCPRDWYNY